MPAREPCAHCGDEQPLDFRFSYAFQPIVALASRQIFAHEALVRGIDGSGAASVLDRITEANRYRFDQTCRVTAIKLAARMGLQSRLSINFMPNAIYRPEVCIRATLAAAAAHDFPVDRIIFETVEGEEVSDGKWLAEVLSEYKRIGFLTAIDDFGAGFAGLNLLADFQPDLVKLDMALVRGIDQSRARQAIVRGVTRICQELNVDIIAEGVETHDEHALLRDLGIDLMQGYYFSRPVFEGSVEADAIHWSS
ncbi:MAG: EAL domain-containing protein [Pseudoxanthomonas sp.]